MAALITRCPACATMFKVVPDQLRVSEGWVRCGHCGEVFDARAHLQEADAVAQAQSDAAAASPEPAEPAPPPPASIVREQAASNDSELPSELNSDLTGEPVSELPSDLPSAHSITSRLEDEVHEGELHPDELAAAAQTLIEDPRDRPFTLRREDLSQPGDLVASASMASSFEPSELPHSSFLPSTPLEEPVESVGFVRQARREARWRHPTVRALLVVAAVLLAVLLALQIAVQDRDRLAAAQPSLRPLLASLCESLGCRIAPPRQIDAIAIDSSSFNKLRPDAYRLLVTLKNQSRTEVAMPALELTLTDSDEQPVVRRVLLPAEFGANRATIAPTSEWSGGAAIALTDTTLASRVAGYRLLAFYP